MEREKEIGNNKFTLGYSLTILHHILNGEESKLAMPFSVSAVMVGALKAIRHLEECMINVADQKAELLSLGKTLVEKGLLKKDIIAGSTENQRGLEVLPRQAVIIKRPTKKSMSEPIAIERTRPTKEEIVKKAEEFVERMKGTGYHGDIHNQIVGWSRGERAEEAQQYYPGWTKADFLLYAQEIKKLEPESEWGTAFHQI